MKKKYCVRCGHEEGFEKMECGASNWGQYTFFGKNHRYKPYTKKELNDSEKEFFKIINNQKEKT